MKTGRQRSRRIPARAGAALAAVLAGLAGWGGGRGGPALALPESPPVPVHVARAAAATVPAVPAQQARAPEPAYPPLPADAGSGRRIVYGNAEQRLWLVEEDGRVASSYLVSGHDNFPKPGVYGVYSKSRHSRAGAVTMEYMVRFTTARGKAVGFHSIPVFRSGRLLQPESDLGRPVGRGCVRQRLADAAFLWDWAPEGTQVVVTP